MATPGEVLWPAGWRHRPGRVCAGIAGMASSTASNPACTWRAPSLGSRWSVAGRQGAGGPGSDAPPPARRCADGPASCSGVAQDFAPGHPCAGPPPSAGLWARGWLRQHGPRRRAHRAGAPGAAQAGLGLQHALRRRSRTSEVLRPSVKAAKGLSTLRVRHGPGSVLLKTLTWCRPAPAVRAQAMPQPRHPQWRCGAVPWQRLFGGRWRARRSGALGMAGFLAEAALIFVHHYTPGSPRCSVWIRNGGGFSGVPARGGAVQLFQPPLRAPPGARETRPTPGIMQ